MKNPWKRLSKINPQREDGTRQINSDVLHALVKAKLPTAEMSVVLIIISKTWGFNKTSDTIATSQFAKESGFPGRTIKRVRQDLLKKRMIYFQESKRVIRGTPLNEYSFNKHYDTWIIQDTKKGVTHSTGVIGGKKRVSPATPTIETITIERKEIYKENFLGVFKIKQPIPSNYTFQPEHLEYAISKGMSEETAKDEFEAFCLWHGAKGTKYVNWFKTYQTWVRNYFKNKKPNGRKIQWDKIAL